MNTNDTLWVAFKRDLSTAHSLHGKVIAHDNSVLDPLFVLRLSQCVTGFIRKYDKASGSDSLLKNS